MDKPVQCLDCGGPYDELMACDLVLPRAQWLQIHPDDGGVLCANCILRRASKLPGVINITGIITNADNSREVYDRLSVPA